MQNNQLMQIAKIKTGMSVRVFADPLTCKEFEFVGRIKEVLKSYDDNLTVYCEVEDEYGDKFNRKINVETH